MKTVAPQDDQSPILSNSFISGSVIILCIAVIVVSCLRNPVDYDSWWHLKMGQDLIENDLSPYIDHYSSTYSGAAISNPPVLFQVGYYYLNHWFGERGGQIAIKMFSYLVLLFLFILWQRMVKAPPWGRALVLAILVTAMQARMQIRPELISYSLTVIAFILYWKASRDFSWRTLVPIALLLLVWVNYHNPLFGYVVFFGLFIDVALRKLSESPEFRFWLRWCAWGLLLVGIGFLRPDGQHFIESWLSFSPEWRENIREYFPPTSYTQHLPTYLWLVAAALAVILSALQRKWGYLIVLAVFLFGGFSMSRMVVPSTVVILCILTDNLAIASSSATPLIPSRSFAKFSRAAMVALTLTALGSGIYSAHVFLYENRSTLPNVPVAAVNYLEEIQAEGAIFNVYKLGGYVLYRLGPQLKVYIDGRTDILYPIEHFLRYNKARDTGSVFRAEVEKYNMDYALVRNNEAIGRMMHASDFYLEFSDSQFSLYKRGSGRFELLGELSSTPYCTDLIQNERLNTEAHNGFRVNPDIAFINPILALAYNYRNSDQPESFLANLDESQLVHRPAMRLYAALTMKHELDEDGLRILDSMEFLLPRDMLAAVFMRLRSGQRSSASEQLKLALLEFLEWEYVFQRDLEILNLLLNELDPEEERGLMTPESRKALADSVSQPGSLNHWTDMDASHFCSSEPWGNPEPAIGND